MERKRPDGFILSCRVVGVGIVAGFLVDMLGHAWAVFRAGLPVTLANIHAYGTRAFHTEVWVVSGLVCVIIGAFVVGSIVGALLENRRTDEST